MKVIVLVSLFFALNSCSSQVNENSIVNDSSEYINDIITEPEVVISDRIVLLKCSDSSFIYSYDFKIPDSCLKIFVDSQGEIDDDARNSNYIDCRNEYFLNPANNFTCDTFFLEGSEVLVTMQAETEEDIFYKNENDLFSDYSGERNLIKFYKLEELKGTCISGEFRIKSIESWLNGEKDGVWEYYYKTGELKRVIHYKSDKIMRDERF